MSRTVTLGAAAIAAAVVVLVIFWAVVNGIGGGPETAASDFFAAIPAKGAQAAYATTSPDFQRAIPVDAFTATAQASGLDGYQSSNWVESGDTGGVVQLTGVLNLKGGGVIPARVALRKGSDGWLVQAVNLPNSGPAQPSGSQDAGAPSAAMGASTIASPPPAASSVYGSAPYAGYASSRSAGMTGGEGTPSTQAPSSQTPFAQAPTTTQAPTTQAPELGQRSANAPIVVASAEVARICGLDIRRHGPVETLDVHCAHGLRAAHGATAQCMAVINGDRQDIAAVLRGYDPVSGRSDVQCHPER